MQSVNDNFFYFRNLQQEYERLKLVQHDVKTPSSSILDDSDEGGRDAEMIAEAKLLRQHKGRLEARMQILEDHNRQLEAQLHRLRQLLEQVTTVLICETLFSYVNHIYAH